MLPDVFQNFQNMWLEKYEHDPAHLLTTTGLAWQAVLKKTILKLDLLTTIDMLLTVATGIKGGICHAIHQCTKANNKSVKNYDKNKESTYLKLIYMDEQFHKSYL